MSENLNVEKFISGLQNTSFCVINTLPDIPNSNFRKQKQHFRKSKAFWNQELEKLWIFSCKCEKAYLNFKVVSNKDFQIKNILRLQFKNVEKHFDKKNVTINIDTTENNFLILIQMQRNIQLLVGSPKKARKSSKSQGSIGDY